MKIRTLGLAVLAAIAVAVPASAQIFPNTLPPGEAVIPAVWTPAAALTPTSTRWEAKVSWAITTPVAGVSTYWYKVEHLGLPLGGTPPVQSLKSSTLDVDPALLLVTGPTVHFGQLDDAGNAPGQSWAAEPVGLGDTSIRWSWYAGLAGLNQLTAGETVYLWVQSSAPTGWVNITLQDGTIGQTKVPGPAPVPEPMTMALVGLGLGVVGGLRKKASRA